MNKNNKLSQLISTSTTQNSLFESICIPNISQQGLKTPASKKFARKKDSPNQSRFFVGTPRSGRSSNVSEEKEKNVANQQLRGSKIKILNSNTYLKIVNSPQVEQKFRTKTQLNGSSRQHSIERQRKDLNVINLSQVAKKCEEKSYRNFRIINSGRSIEITDNQNQNQNQNQSRDNFVDALRNLKTEVSVRSSYDNYLDIRAQTQILENQKMILQDEIRRLKNQIKDLLNERNRQMEKINNLQKSILYHQNFISQIKEKQCIGLSQIQEELTEIYYQFNKVANIFPNLGKDIFNQGLTWRKKINYTKPKVEMMDQFISQFFRPFSNNIQNSMHKFEGFLREVKVSIQKMEIKQNIMTRTQLELQNLKGQIKSLNQRHKCEKDRCNRYKQMYEKLKKFNSETKSRQHARVIRQNEKQNPLRSSTSLLGYRLKVRQTSQDDLSLILSDISDQDQSSKGGSQKRSIKKI